MIDNLKVGNPYSKQDLKVLLNEESLGTMREGFFPCKNSPVSILFVDLEKAGKEKRFHFDDYYDGSTFHWDSQPRQSINVPTIQDLVTERRTPILFARVDQKIKGATQPFVYCGRLKFNSNDEKTSKPVHILFDSLDYTDSPSPVLKEIYEWSQGKVMNDDRVTFRAPLVNKPQKQKKKTVDQNESTDSETRKKGAKETDKAFKFVNNSLDPDTLTETDKETVLKVRTKQGKFRDALRERYGDKCCLTGLSEPALLIASHIKPFSKCEDFERQDPNNGFLLASHIDALFDKNFISFYNDGTIIISERVSMGTKKIMGIERGMKLKFPITDENKTYLAYHRSKLVQ